MKQYELKIADITNESRRSGDTLEKRQEINSRSCTRNVNQQVPQKTIDSELRIKK
ncbi:hypothetical protein VCR15J2_470821 [Vibrio coralliirubri]|uniref:Uncharacterized protein n=1 Tax=Vibrio coralliirubri TaxID=1516159 RepID=A0AA86X026_9VIBR|nr:hypothetical protein VCR31J2_1270812 [Vibrio coralliirubri]CDT70887.1 hypothetical protein VCR15J2_470821 [Vibrio coralliirubri]